MIPEKSNTIVQIEEISHRFGHFEALKNLSLTIRRGDIYGLLGLNGAGKTTTIRILLGLLRRQSGRVMLFGQPREEKWLGLCGRIGATIEGPTYYPHLSGLANLALFHGLSYGGGRSPREALELVGLSEAAHVKTRKYSMGMLQRLYLAQALLHSPEFLVLDEPTSNLDPKGILEVRKLIQRINREEGVTVLLSSHQLSEVEDLCNRVAIINRGRRIVESTVIELFQSEECRVEIQVERPEEALAFLRKLDWAKDAEAREGLISARIPRARRGELNGLLVRDGFVVHDFTERRPTLEDYFHQRIAEDAA